MLVICTDAEFYVELRAIYFRSWEQCLKLINCCLATNIIIGPFFLYNLGTIGSITVGILGGIKEQLTVYINALLWGITIAVDTAVHSLVCSVNVGYGESVSIDHVFGEGRVQEISDHFRSR